MNFNSRVVNIKELQNGGISFVAWTSRPLPVDCKLLSRNHKTTFIQRLHTKIVVAIEDRDEGRTLQLLTDNGWKFEVVFVRICRWIFF